jgi:hypothetical protein
LNHGVQVAGECATGGWCYDACKPPKYKGRNVQSNRWSSSCGWSPLSQLLSSTPRHRDAHHRVRTHGALLESNAPSPREKAAQRPMNGTARVPEECLLVAPSVIARKPPMDFRHSCNRRAVQKETKNRYQARCMGTGTIKLVSVSDVPRRYAARLGRF